MLLITLGLVFGTAGLVAADDGPVLHEYVPELGADEGMMVISSSDGEQAEAIVYQGEILSAPDLDEARSRDEAPMRALPAGDYPGQAGRRSRSFHPDRVTDLQGGTALRYFTVFTPTIAPFKRVTSLDRVTIAADGTPVLDIADAARRTVWPGPGVEPDDGLPRDRFWGSVVLDFSDGAEVPFPSVSPTSRILSLETNPPIDVRITRDRADNFYAQALARGMGEVRVVFLTDAPRAFFGREYIPAGRVDALAAHVPALPSRLRSVALGFARDTLGVTARSGFEEALSALTRHFRDFQESRTPPRNTGDVYLDLAQGGVGICRHRAYAFVITAQALGIHARFVHNEVHAWVEVEMPRDGGWLRVDLGGAEAEVRASGSDRPVHRPELPDPLPRPERYERAFVRAQQMSGLRSSSGGASDGAASGSSSGGAGSSASASSSSAQALTLRVDQSEYAVLRGRELSVSGSARGGGVGISGLRVEVLLRSPTREERIGVTVTNERGRFVGTFGVPQDLAVGDYSLIVSTPGDGERWAPAIAR